MVTPTPMTIPGGPAVWMQDVVIESDSAVTPTEAVQELVIMIGLG